MQLIPTKNIKNYPVPDNFLKKDKSFKKHYFRLKLRDTQKLKNYSYIVSIRIYNPLELKPTTTFIRV